jgi:hypothetical protein
MAYIALHNFISDSKLYNKEFDKCDTNEKYMPRASNTATQTQGGHKVEGENEFTMNIIHDRLATALASAEHHKIATWMTNLMRLQTLY